MGGFVASSAATACRVVAVDLTPEARSVPDRLDAPLSELERECLGVRFRDRAAGHFRTAIRAP